jgi:hypothetical protein
MEMDKFAGRIWVVAHKPIAVAAGLGVMGIHRNVIHPKFGNFILLGTTLVDAPISSYGFTDWVQTIADSADAADFRSRVSDSENASMRQSLSFKPNYKAAYCLAVCPAGEEVVEPYLDDRKGFMDLVLKPLQDNKETLYVPPNSKA